MLLAHLTDLHVRPHGLPAYRTAETNMLVERALDAVLALDPRPDAVLITGDLTDNGLPAEYENLKRMLSRLPMPVWLIPGNHDRRENLKAILGDFPGLSDEPHFAQWATDLGPVRMIGLDTVVPGSGAGRLCAERLAWLEERLAEAPGKPTIVALPAGPFQFRAGGLPPSPVDGGGRSRQPHRLCREGSRSLPVPARRRLSRRLSGAPVTGGPPFREPPAAHVIVPLNRYKSL